MFRLFGNLGKTKEEIVAVFDIGNGSIGGALVQISHGQPPTILYACREPLTYMSQATSARLLANMVKLLKHVSLRMHKEGLPKMNAHAGHTKLHKAFCIFSSPWYVSQTRVIKAAKDEPFLVTETLMNKLLAKEEYDFQTALNEGKYEKIFGNDVDLLERKIIHTKLNGYEIHDPIGKKAREFEVTFFSSFISKNILDHVEEALSHAFHFLTLKHSSYALASWSTALDMHPTHDDFLFMDVTNEVTDIVQSGRGILSGTVSFPVGRATLLRSIVEKLSVPPEVAVSFLAMRLKGTLEKEFSAKLDAVIAESVAEWLGKCTETLKTMGDQATVPRRIYLTIDADVSAYYAGELSKNLAVKLGISDMAFQVVVLDAETMRQYVVDAPGIPQDPFLMIDSIFVHKLVS